jgi:predicted dehydrogenase
MRVGVVGVGVAAQSHLLDLVSSSEFTVDALCASRIERARPVADRYGVASAFDDLDRMLAEVPLDALVIATPPTVTPDMAARGFARGLPAVIDKPAGGSAAQLDGTFRSGGRRPVRAAVAYNRRYQSHVRTARTLLARDEIGSLHSVECRWSGPFTHRYTCGQTHRQYAGWGDGVVLDTASHMLDTLMFLGIRPLSVLRARLTSGPSGADVSADMYVGCELVAQPVRLSIHDGDDVESWKILLRGSRGELHLNRAGMTGTIKGGPVAEAASDLRRPVDDLLALAGGGQPCGASLPEALDVLAVIDEIRTAASRHRWLRPRAKALGRLNGAC